MMHRGLKDQIPARFFLPVGACRSVYNAVLAPWTCIMSSWTIPERIGRVTRASQDLNVRSHARFSCWCVRARKFGWAWVCPTTGSLGRHQQVPSPCIRPITTSVPKTRLLLRRMIWMMSTTRSMMNGARGVENGPATWHLHPSLHTRACAEERPTSPLLAT